MRVIRNRPDRNGGRGLPGRSAVTVGNFDGVHQGHQHLLGKTVAEARSAGTPSAVLTFNPAPRDVLRPDNDIPRIQAIEDRVACLHAVGIDQVVVQPFTLDLARLSPERFAQEILADGLRVAGLVLGWDFRFGAKRAGTVPDLQAWLDVPVHQVDALHADGGVASSSRIRELVRAGEVAAAARLLTRPHLLRGTVVQGDQRGRTLGFPTANVAVETPLEPASGVYAVRARIGEQLLPGVANFGNRPTFGGGRRVLEVHVLDANLDLYGQAIAVDLIERIRGERSFDGVDALKRQIDLDVGRAREILR